jgi:hypothetical protein
MENNIDLDQEKNAMKMAKRRCEQRLESSSREHKEVRCPRRFNSCHPDHFFDIACPCNDSL